MRVLFVNVYPYLPQLFGGVETSTDQLCRRLQAAGHQMAVLCGIKPSGALWAWNRVKSRLTGRRFPRDVYKGTSVYRGFDVPSGVQEVLEDFRPDVVVVSGGTDGTVELAARVRDLGLRTFHYFHDIASVRRIRTIPTLAGVGFFANSRYTASKVHELLGVSATVIPPLVEAEQYRTETSRQHVTMVNPRQIKGGRTALDLAKACPDIPFVIVEAWDGDEFVDALRTEASHLGNVRWMRATRDIQSVYASTRIMLVPSEWEETWGRVVTEAHASAIPVLASSVAALPETVGPGGLLVEPHSPLETWIAALRTLWDDHRRYDELSMAARTYSQRREISPDYLAGQFLKTLQARL